MDCGIPFCHSFGCPLDNLIPDLNDMVYRGQWRKALDLLHSTNNFPEFTGRICPALCEAACTLMIDEKPVSIRQIELQIVERGWEEGWIKPEPAAAQDRLQGRGHRLGPAGLAAAQQLARAGHDVMVFEKDDRIGGILRYGIPDFKLEKWVIDRRLEQMAAEGVASRPASTSGADISAALPHAQLRRHPDRPGRACRATCDPGPRPQGRPFAMDFLTQQNRRNAGDDDPA